MCLIFALFLSSLYNPTWYQSGDLRPPPHTLSARRPQEGFDLSGAANLFFLSSSFAVPRGWISFSSGTASSSSARCHGEINIRALCIFAFASSSSQASAAVISPHGCTSRHGHVVPMVLVSSSSSHPRRPQPPPHGLVRRQHRPSLPRRAANVTVHHAASSWLRWLRRVPCAHLGADFTHRPAASTSTTPSPLLSEIHLRRRRRTAHLFTTPSRQGPRSA